MGEVCRAVPALTASPSSFVRLRFACRERGFRHPHPRAFASLGCCGWPGRLGEEWPRFARLRGLGLCMDLEAAAAQDVLTVDQLLAKKSAELSTD
jgi:hypothetical protein